MDSSESGDWKAKDGGGARRAARRIETNERARVGTGAPDLGTYVKTFLVAKVLPSWGATALDAAGGGGGVGPHFFGRERGAVRRSRGGECRHGEGRGRGLAGG